MNEKSIKERLCILEDNQRRIEASLNHIITGPIYFPGTFVPKHACDHDAAYCALHHNREGCRYYKDGD